ncbi:MAG: tetratricopeptide repeat protein [Alphaproteobacteria bacterium]|nr:tetratricopeptide repeat protein [Alphaproteobacteria bacterium]
MDTPTKKPSQISVTSRTSTGAGLRQLAHVAWQLHQSRLWPQAEAIFRYVIAEDPKYARALNNLSVVRGCQNEMAEAEQLSRRAIELEPANSSYRSNLATTLLDLGRFDEAEAEYRKVLELDPQDPHASASLGILLLRTGRFDEAWPFYRARKRPKRYAFLDEELRGWKGESLRGKALVVLNEQGLGEEFQVARLYTQLCGECDDITLTCDPRIAELMVRSFPALNVLAHDDTEAIEAAVRKADYVTFLTNLIAQLAPDAKPETEPRDYLRADGEQVAGLRRKYRDLYGERKLIGFSWGTSSSFKQSARTIPVDQWKALLAREDCQFISLQYSTSAPVLAEYARNMGVSIAVDETIDAKDDLDGLAAQIAALDHVISIDNTTVHLAAALGQPVWTLLMKYPHWLWGLKGDRSAWYPTMRLFRQIAKDEWTPVLEEVEAELEAQLAETPANNKSCSPEAEQDGRVHVG